jgi:hypothetical protein
MPDNPPKQLTPQASYQTTTGIKTIPPSFNRYASDFSSDACLAVDTEARSRVSTFTASSTTALLIAVK